MRIAFDPQTFCLQEYGGVSRYFFETAAHLSKLPDTDVRVLAFAHINAYLAGAPRGAVVGARLTAVPPPVRRLLVCADRLLARAWLARHDADLVHETYYFGARALRKDAPTVLTVFDMIHEKFPDYAPRTQWVARAKRAAIARADHLICISESTQRDLVALLGVDPARTSVVRLGFTSPGATAAPRPVSAPYILFVGKRSGYKDFETLLRAYAGARELAKEHLLVCFGDAPFAAREQRLMRSLGIAPERVIHDDGADARLAAYYRHAALFVYPSRYEGFGMPPLEAMSQECPVVCSNAASLPEVAGDAARLFEAGNVEALRAAMEDVVGSPALASRLRQAGIRRAAAFSWDECARQTRAVYETVLARHCSSGEQIERMK
jgi:glycosyltransferase involved in cell wall biosynthesis